jgi:hypothetical protein
MDHMASHLPLAQADTWSEQWSAYSPWTVSKCRTRLLPLSVNKLLQADLALVLLGCSRSLHRVNRFELINLSSMRIIFGSES